MRRVQTVHASLRYGRAIAAVADLLARLRLESVFVGSVARSAWLGSRVDQGSLEVVALMTSEQKNQVAMMAGNRGFRVDREEVEHTAELDLIPMHFVDPEGEVRIHVLVASNALYGKMVRAGVAVETIRVAAIEDLALLFALGDDDDSQRAASMLVRLPEFDRIAYNERLISIGLPHYVVNS
jgi:hypothetical protein